MPQTAKQEVLHYAQTSDPIELLGDGVDGGPQAAHFSMQMALHRDPPTGQCDTATARTPPDLHLQPTTAGKSSNNPVAGSCRAGDDCSSFGWKCAFLLNDTHF